MKHCLSVNGWTPRKKNQNKAHINCTWTKKTKKKTEKKLNKIVIVSLTKAAIVYLICWTHIVPTTIELQCSKHTLTRYPGFIVSPNYIRTDMLCTYTLLYADLSFNVLSWSICIDERKYLYKDVNAPIFFLLLLLRFLSSLSILLAFFLSFEMCNCVSFSRSFSFFSNFMMPVTDGVWSYEASQIEWFFFSSLFHSVQIVHANIPIVCCRCASHNVFYFDYVQIGIQFCV